MNNVERKDHSIRSHGNCIKLWKIIYRYRGLIAAFGVACLSSVVTILVSFVRGTSDASQLVFARGFIGFICSLILLIRLGIQITPTCREEIRGLALQGISVAVVVWSLYYAYQNMPTADATAIVYGYIAFSVVFGRIFLKEPLGCLEAAMVAITIIGVVLIIRPPFLFGSYGSKGSTQLLPALSALCSSLFSALITVALRVLGKQHTNPLKSVLYSSICLMVLSSVSITIKQDWNIPGCISTRLLVITLSAFAFFTLLTFAYALTVENIVVVTVITVSEVCIVFFADIFLLGTVPNWISIVGILMIVSSSFGISCKKIMHMRKEPDHNKNNDVIEESAAKDIKMKNEDENKGEQYESSDPSDSPL